MMNSIILSNIQVKDVCKRGQHECCSYLTIGGNGWCCAKNTHFASIIEQRRSERTMKAMGNNCSGPPDFMLYSESNELE